MKPLYLLVLLLASSTLLAQPSNYVATAPLSATPAIYNTLVGPNAGNTAMTGTSNTFLGYNAGVSSLDGSNNTFLGAFAGRFNTSGWNNLFIGLNAGYANNSGQANVFLGNYSGGSNTSGASNVFVGVLAGNYNTSGTANVFVGPSSGSGNTTGDNNTFIGNAAGRGNATGLANVFVGSQAGYSNTSGTGNMFLGQQAGFNSTGSYNLFMGNSSGSSTTSGLGNTAIGDGSLLRNNTGIHNVAIGRFAGVENRSDENTFIGFAADVTPDTPNLTNATAIGARARVSQSNSIVLGANANVGIGNGAPSAKLHITSGLNGKSGLRLENLTINNTATLTDQNKFLSVDGLGNVILVSQSGSARQGATNALWQRKGSFLQSTNGESIVIGQGVDKIPSGYSLFVGQGLLAEKVKVAVKNTSDWSDYVFMPGYALQSLAQVEQYIQANKHLPGVPSAKEMVEQGNDLHKTDAKLLEKIEELTLYSIQLEKQLQANDKKHQAEINELKQLVKQLVDKK